jgi:hypothetical protein
MEVYITQPHRRTIQDIMLLTKSKSTVRAGEYSVYYRGYSEDRALSTAKIIDRRHQQE